MSGFMHGEKARDRLIRGIAVFEKTGQIVYSTDRQRVGEKVANTWTEAAARSKTTEWGTEAADEHVAGISLKNNFDLTGGFLAMRYSAEEVERAAKVAGREILTAPICSLV